MTRSGSKSPSKKSYSPAKSKYPPKARAEKWRSLCIKHASRIEMLAKATLSTPDDSLKGATPGPVAILQKVIRAHDMALYSCTHAFIISCCIS